MKLQKGLEEELLEFEILLYINYRWFKIILIFQKIIIDKRVL